MNIGFVLPGAAISGGIYVVFEHATRIKHSYNCQVFIITEAVVTPDEHAWHSEAASLTWLTFKEAKLIKFDIVIATFWRTVYALPQFDANHYAYFVQSIESKFYPEEDPYVIRWVDSTYSFCLKTITEAFWIKSYLEENYKNSPFLVKNGIRKDLYTTSGTAIAPRQKGKLRVLVEGPLDINFKNVAKTLKLCKDSDADEVWLLTSTITQDTDLADRVFSKVSIDRVPEIYRSCDVIVKLSYVEGMFGPPLEMFHCGGTAIVYNVTGHEEYIIDKNNALVIDKDDEVGVISAINHLKHTPDYLELLKQNAIATASKWPDWQYSANEFYQVLVKINQLVPDNRNQLKALSNQIQQWVELVQLKNQIIQAKELFIQNILILRNSKLFKLLRYFKQQLHKLFSK